MKYPGSYNRKEYNILGLGNHFFEVFSRIKDKGILEIIDCGCGNGRLSIPLALQGYNLTSFDPSKNAIESLSKKINELEISNLKVFCEDLSSIEITQTYDLAISWRVMHIGYSDTRSKMWKNFFNLIKSGFYGIAAVAAEKCETMAVRLADKSNELVEKNSIRYRSHGNMHVKHYYSIEELEEIISLEDNLKILEIGFVREPSGHPEDLIPRTYIWVILQKI